MQETAHFYERGNMKYTEYEKKTLGNLFRYLRNKNELLISDIIDQICSEKTYREIEKGIIKKDKYYEELIHSFGYTYQSLNELKEWLNTFMPSFYHACDYMDEKAISNHYKQQKDYFSDKKDSILYHQYSLLFDYLFRYYKYDRYLTADEIREILTLLEFVEDESLKVLLIEVMDLSNWNEVCDQQLAQLIFDLLDEDCTNTIIMYHYSLKKEYDYEIFQSLKIFENLRDILKNTDNDYRKCRTEIAIFNIIDSFEVDKAENEMIPELLRLAKSKKIPRKLEISIYFNIASHFYHVKHDYKTAYDYYSLSFKMDNSLKTTLLYLCSCCRELGYELPNELNNFKENISQYLEYFIRMKKGASYKSLEDFIMHNLIDLLKFEKHYEPFWKMFESELNLLVSETRDYSLLHNYRAIMKKYKVVI